MSGPEENPHAGQGAVLLDIGGDIGALVVTMPQMLVGTEVEIRPISATGHDHGHDHGHGHGHGHDHGSEGLAHVAVVNRPVPGGGHVPSLVFPELLEGGYELFEKGHAEAVVLVVDIVGGQVTMAQWPTPED